jgi:S1-C subfamily serine protease
MGIVKYFSILVALVLVTSVPAGAEPGDLDAVSRSVVKIFTTYRMPDFYQPWQYKNQNSGIASGVIIEGTRILTNAHVAHQAVFIQVKKPNDPQRYIAEVVAVGHQEDLAVLQVKDPTFYKGTRPLSMGELPTLLDAVSVYGFPQGGAEISITQGVVSRIEMTRYAHSGMQLLGVQIDAAINPGNSGGPVVKKGKLVGVAMQTMSAGENIGYLIPRPVIDHFLADIEDGTYDGFPEDGLLIQLAENRSLRRYFGMKEKETGVIVADVIHGSSSDGLIVPGDVVTAISGEPLADDGSVVLDRRTRVDGNFVVQRRQVGETITLDIIRQKKPMQVTLPLKPPAQLVPQIFDERPSYVIFGGFVFVPLTVNYLKEWGREWYKNAPAHLLHLAFEEFPTTRREEVVILRSALAHDITAGYQELQNLPVVSVNGELVGSLAALKATLDKSVGEYTIITLDRGQTIVIDNAAADTSESEILQRYAIPAPVSEDLR